MDTMVINFDNLETQYSTINKQLVNFEPYSKEFIEGVMDGLDGQDSDFIQELEKLLRAMKDTKATKIYNNLVAFEAELRLYIDGWKAVDQECAEKFHGGHLSE